MVYQVVWQADAPVSRVVVFREAFAAFIYHYQRVAFGPNYKKGV